MTSYPFVTPARLVRHMLLWLVVWLFFRYVNFGLYISDSERVVNMLTAVTFGQTIGLFYLFGYWVFPRYLYRFRFLWFSLFALLAYYVIYLSSYLATYFLQQISLEKDPSSLSQVEQSWALIQPVGLLGCFTSIDVALWNLNNFFYVTLLLGGKLVRDVFMSRTRTLLIERDAVDLERTNLALERDNLTLELDLLKSQVNPHFLFNALNSIYARVVDVNEPAAELVLHLAELMRYNLYEANVPQIDLADEIAYIENYLSLEKIRHASMVDVIFSADGDFTGHPIAPLLLIAFVENAFKHSLGAGPQSAYVLVDTQLQDDTFYFTVQNSLPQQPQPPTAKKSGGIGLVNVQKRLSLLYPERYILDVRQTATSYTTVLQLQLGSTK